MAKRKKANPWDAAFQRVKAPHWPEFNYPPRTTSLDLDEGEKQLKFKFPASYRVFANEFGLGGYLACSLPHLLPIFRPAWAEPTSWSQSVVDATDFYHTYDWGEVAWDTEAASLTFSKRVIVFAMDSGYHEWVFHPLEMTAKRPREYAIYDVNRSHHAIRIASSFPEWLDWIRQNYTFEKEDDEPAQEPEFPVAYKPDSPHSDAMLYFRDSNVDRKQRPDQTAIQQWLAFNNHAVRDLALSIRDEKRPDVFPILADALQEAGCTNADMLNSCRTGDPDIDGVWVLRVLLGNGS